MNTKLKFSEKLFNDLSKFDLSLLSDYFLFVSKDNEELLLVDKSQINKLLEIKKVPLNKINNDQIVNCIRYQQFGDKIEIQKQLGDMFSTVITKEGIGIVE